MKKLFNCIIALIAAGYFSLTCYADNKPLTADIISDHIPAGTVISVRTQNPINSDTAKVGENFNIITTKDIISNVGTLLLPQGTLIRGSIVDIKSKKMLSKDACIYVIFDHLVTSTGTQIPVKIAFHSNGNFTADGGLGYGGNYGTATKQNWNNTQKIVTTMTKWGYQTGEKAWNGWPKFVLSPITAIVSIPCALVYIVGDQIVDVFKFGDNITVNQNQEFNVMFINGINIPIS